MLVAGTTSDAGKTVVTTGLCRAFARRGLTVVPFKAQNMSNNSMVCADGAEIGRAQWIQALAAGAVPEPAMNPVLLKPGGDRRSQCSAMSSPGGRCSASAVGSRCSVGTCTTLTESRRAGLPASPGSACCRLETTFSPQKTVRLSEGRALGATASGYTTTVASPSPAARTPRISAAGFASAGWRARCGMEPSSRTGCARRCSTSPLGRGRAFAASGVSFARRREQRLDLLADLVERHLDVEALLRVARRGPGRVPVIGPHE
ncbi:cobyric acid synthase [Saccharomonospora azurea SZMC 14600]|uniref:nucleotide-binding protein n=1 Tax=Saccharomonospora azurea TaxID=40988 RepID=UPI00023FEE73|nr:cobyric acid synthase [Saccharomonospora azurea SZMC 14600]EHK81427.1 cobyric acid synthase [Saccharomonospora azurea SZMC 14600]